MDYIIGIDAGGTKTVAISYDLKGNKLNQAIDGPGNLTVSFEQAIENIRHALDSLLSFHQNDICLYACVGCAGAETGDVKQRATDAFKTYFKDVIKTIFVTNDAMLGLYSALEGEDGVLVISGTGSIGYLKKGDKLSRFGGWGHLVSDEGSGYYIGITAIKYITYSFDSGNFETPLKKAVFEILALSDLRQLIDFTYKAKKSDIAALTPVIEKLAESGDPQAGAILSKAGEKLAYFAINLLRRDGLKKPKIAISGSVLRKTLPLKLSFIETLDLHLKDYILIERDFEPSKACYYLYIQNNASGKKPAQ